MIKLLVLFIKCIVAIALLVTGIDCIFEGDWKDGIMLIALMLILDDVGD